MKKILVIVIGLVLIVALAGPFASGFILESRFDRYIKFVVKKLPVNSIKIGKFKRGWFSSSVKVAIKDKSMSIDIEFNISHGPVLLNKGSLIFGAGYVDFAISGKSDKSKGIMFVKDILAQARVDIVLNYQDTVAVNIKIRKLTKPIKYENFSFLAANNLHFYLNVTGSGVRGQSGLAFDELVFKIKKIKININKYDSAMTSRKSSKGANLENSYVTVNNIKIAYNINAKPRVVKLEGVTLKSDTNVVMGNIVQELPIKVNAIIIPGFKPMSLTMRLWVNNLSEEAYAKYEKVMSTKPLNALKLSKVITKMIAGKPEFGIDKASLTVGDKKVVTHFLFKGVPLKKGDIISFLNFRTAFYLKSNLVAPKVTLRQIMTMVSYLTTDLSALAKTERDAKINNEIDSQIKSWLEKKYISESKENYQIELEINKGKMFFNSERLRSFLFP